MSTLFYDSETDGLDPHNNRVTLAQYLWAGEGEVTLLQDPDYAELHDLLDSADRVVMHNASFDLGMIGYIPSDPSKFEDTLYLSRIVDYKEERHSLDLVAERVFGYDVYKDFDKKRLQKSDWASAELTDEQRKYAATDVQILPAIWLKFKHAADHPVYRFDKQSIIAGLTVQQHGLPINHQAVTEERNDQQRRLDDLLLDIPCNPNSPKQVCELLGIPSSGDRVLAEMVAEEGDEMAANIRAARKAGKYINFLDKLNAHDRYTGTLQPAARSGRFTSKQNNIQNLPRDTKKFVATNALNVLVAADFAQLELRTIAAIAEDETMLTLFKSGQDLHNYSAEQMYGKDFTKTQRQIAKVFNFSLLYGAGARTVRDILIQQTGIILNEHEVAALKRKWLAAFDGIAHWQKRGAQRHELGYPYHTPQGRQYVSKMFTDHLSIENQGAGAEVARIALHRILKTLPKRAKLINFIHDSYLVECPDDPAIYEPAAKAVHAAMTFAWEKAPFKKHGLEMPVTVGVARNLKDADALENCIYIYEGEK